jgi:hypothetical protein
LRQRTGKGNVGPDAESGSAPPADCCHSRVIDTRLSLRRNSPIFFEDHDAQRPVSCRRDFHADIIAFLNTLTDGHKPAP